MEEILHEFVIIALLSILVIYACHKIKVPPIVGFLITGALFGPSALGLVKEAHAVETLSEIGVVFLLFSIGMELSISELIRLKKPVFLGGTFQVAITIAAFCLLSTGMGIPFNSALFIGFLMALSSTAIVLKIMQQRAQIESPAGRISLSILIYQDLVIVPMMLAVPLLAGATQADAASLLLTAGRTLSIIGIIFLLARKGVPWILRRIVGTRSRELFLISVIGICLGTAYLTFLLGLSLSLGAFMAGLVVAESEYSHSALEGILPFRDVFTSVFFVSVGMLLDMTFFFSHIGEVAAITLLAMTIKGIIAGSGALLLGYPARPAIIVGMAICQVGEFSFVLAKAGLDHSLLSREHYQFFLAASILSMAATPFLLSAGPAVAELWERRRRKPAIDEAEKNDEADATLSDHLIIIGYGVGGKFLARAARDAGIRHVILEMNPDTVRQHAARGESIFHGDATHPAILQHLGIRTARVLAIVISDPTAVRGITEIARHLNKHVHILVRTRFLSEIAALKNLGASDVIPEEFETSIEIFTRVLSRYLVPRSDIQRVIREVRAENYEMLRNVELRGGSIAALQKNIPDFSVSVFFLEQNSSLDGMTLLDAELRQKANITVIAVKRDEEIFAHPDGTFRLQSGDTVYVFSTSADADLAEALFAAG
ncbi:MAG: cation:proton antiporter [Desulfovibrio sp.]|jgi:CPA2 family monovalent cation:H+ antiporter-2|nr:cation:proton antiporter [Desulfovibrio sp.]